MGWIVLLMRAFVSVSAWRGRALWAVGVLVALCCTPMAAGQDEPSARATTAAEMLEALRAMGVELPEGLVAGEDGTVVIPTKGEPNEVVPAMQVPVVVPVEATPDPDPEPAPESKPKPKWKQRAEVALSLNEGNTQTEQMRLVYKATRTTKIDKLVFSGAYYRRTSRGRTSQNRLLAQGNYDRDIPGTRWLWFVNGRYEWDRFQSWDYRTGLSAGVGYRAIDRDDMELILRVGGGFTREFGSDREEVIPEVLLGYDFEWDMSDRHGIESTHRYFPDLDELGEFRTVTTLEWHYALDIMDGLKLSAGLLHEYQSEVASGIEQSDLRLYSGVRFDF